MFLDWALSRYGSPVCDLLYYLFSATNHEFREKHFNNLLIEYHVTLKRNIKELGSDPDKLYPWEQLREDIEKFGRFPLIFVPMLIQLINVDHKYIADMDEYCERLFLGQPAVLIKDFDDETQASFEKILNETITDVVNYCKIK